jgi:dihydrofolate synthase/folylpolyglutamate synthase
MKFLTSGEVFSWLSQFINLERGQKPRSFRLDRMKFLTELAGHPQRNAPSIHIAGSKGKGSVTGMITAILTSAGFRTARYMSPHVIDIRERICLGDSYFDETVYCAAGNELRNLTEQLSVIKQLPAAALFDPSTPDGCEPTFWELLTLLFFLCAKHGNCDIMVVETGMGGRLDSTNILDPIVSVITLIELEHTNFLGNTITEVAGEKAGIIKHGKPLVLAKQSEEALEVFRKKAQEKDSPLLYFPEIAELSGIKVHSGGTDFTLNIPAHIQGNFSIPIPGKVQAENAALAITAVKTAFPQIDYKTINRGLANLSLPARFEKIRCQVPFIIDGAHTPESLTLCIETFCSLYGEGGILVFGCAADKDAAAMAKIAAPHFTKIIITTPGTFKLSNPALVYEAFTALTGKEKTLLVLDTQEAVRQAVNFSREKLTQSEERGKEKYLPILGTGSFYLVSEIRNFFY